jgi:hypothetical protein
MNSQNELTKEVRTNTEPTKQVDQYLDVLALHALDIARCAHEVDFENTDELSVMECSETKKLIIYGLRCMHCGDEALITFLPASLEWSFN